jgi:putative YphP/YqiW family bacilliredoxin
MPYDPYLVQPMRDELTHLGFVETTTPEAVDREIQNTKGTVLVVVNSVCGCAAGKARPGVSLALESEIKPDKCITVFAGMDIEATARAREYFTGYMPSSPSIALLKGGSGELVYMMERHDIEGRDALDIANRLSAAFREHCAAGVKA